MMNCETSESSCLPSSLTSVCYRAWCIQRCNRFFVGVGVGVGVCSMCRSSTFMFHERTSPCAAFIASQMETLPRTSPCHSLIKWSSWDISMINDIDMHSHLGSVEMLRSWTTQTCTAFQESWVEIFWLNTCLYPSGWQRRHGGQGTDCSDLQGPSGRYGECMEVLKKLEVS